MSFFILRCKNCGKWGSKEVREIQSAKFRCSFCYKSFKIKLKNEFGLALLYKGPYDSGMKAAIVCADLNADGKR